MAVLKDITGQRFGRLTALEWAGSLNGKSRWLCKCDCGTTKEIPLSCLKDKPRGSKSCGCYNKEKASQLNKKHGMTKTRIYNIWANMVSRCTNKNHDDYKHYGGRGIQVFPKWKVFQNFYNDMHSGYDDALTLERIDVDGNYEPSNCKWATWMEQRLNKRITIKYKINGEVKTLKQLCKERKISYNTVYGRILKGLSPEVALMLPIEPGKPLKERIA